MEAVPITNPKIGLWLYARADKSFSIAQRHEEFMGAMADIGAPLGFAGLKTPPAPDCGAELIASFRVKLPAPGLRFNGFYRFRGERYTYRDTRGFDEAVDYVFDVRNRHLDYRSVLKDALPRVVAAFKAYRACVIYDRYPMAYAGGFFPSEDGETAFDEQGCEVWNNADYNRLREDDSVDVDGRNNIYTLYPAQYWDAELCRRALGYGPDEVIRRLEGTPALATCLMDGVYVVLDDDPGLSFEAFLRMNRDYKSLLGLV
jgi:hypothetical protein